VGITQGIGVGGRDLKEAVGGIMMLAGLQSLQDDPATEVIVLVSKPPAAAVAQRVLEQVANSHKPTVVCLLGGEVQALAQPQHKMACTLEDAARLAAEFSTPGTRAIPVESIPEDLVAHLRAGSQPKQHYLRALFSGGTLCYEAQVIWKALLREPVFSNAPLPGGPQLPDSTHSQGHAAMDLGEEEFTVGRPHPMIDNDLRIRRLLQEARDPETAVILLDVVIGYGAHPDPAGELAQAVRQARAIAEQAGGSLPVIASVTGAEGDPQRLSAQVQKLEAAGVVVCPSNAAAARLAAQVVL